MGLHLPGDVGGDAAGSRVQCWPSIDDSGGFDVGAVVDFNDSSRCLPRPRVVVEAPRRSSDGALAVVELGTLGNPADRLGVQRLWRGLLVREDIVTRSWTLVVAVALAAVRRWRGDGPRDGLRGNVG